MWLKSEFLHGLGTYIPISKVVVEEISWEKTYSTVRMKLNKAHFMYSTVPNISPYTIIKFLEGPKYQDGAKYIFWTSKYKFWPK